MMKLAERGAVTKWARKCYICKKRRICRWDDRKRYFPHESPVYLIPVCLSSCSQYRCTE